MIIGDIEFSMDVIMQGFLEDPTALELAEKQRDRMQWFCALHSFFFIVSWVVAAFFYEYACFVSLAIVFFAVDYRRNWHKRQRLVELEIVREVLET